MSPITSNLATGAIHALAEVLHLSEAQRAAETNEPPQSPATGNPEPASSAASLLDGLVPSDGLHSIASGGTTAARLLVDARKQVLDLINKQLQDAARKL